MKRSNVKIMRGLLRFMNGMYGYMSLAILLGVIGFLCSILLTLWASMMLLTLLGFSFSLSFTTCSVLLLVMAFVRGFLRYGEQACNHYIAFHLLAQIREQVFAALRKLCPAKLEGKGKGDLIAVITADIELLEVFYAHTLSPIAIAFFVSLVLVILFYQFHPLFALWALASYVIVGIVLPMWISKMTKDIGMRQRQASGALSSFVLDRLRGLQEVLQYQQQQPLLWTLKERFVELNALDEQFKKASGKAMGMTNVCIMALSMGIFVLGAFLYEQQIISFAQVLLAFILLFSSFGPVVALANLGTTLQQTFAAGERVLSLLEETPQVEEVHAGKWVSGSEMQVDHICFAYEEEMILKDVSLQVPFGKTIGLYGRSGCGKSTLLKLLMRFWDVEQGKILLGDVDVKKINTKALRQKQSYMTQETHLFHDTLFENIRIAKADATAEEVIAACKKAHIHEHICSLPKGYDTMASELGDSLSGGEKQRIGLARAFLHDAPLLFLDEPTSNLDSLNEAKILLALAQDEQKRSVVLVSHRASTTKLADTIINVEKGWKPCEQ